MSTHLWCGQIEAALAKSEEEKEEAASALATLRETRGQEVAATAKDKEAAAQENTLLRDEMRAVEELMKQELQTAHDGLELMRQELVDCKEQHAHCEHELSQAHARVLHLSAACEKAQEQGAAERQEREEVVLQLDSLKMSLVDRDTMAEVERATFKDELQHQRAKYELVERDLKREMGDLKCQVEALKMDNDMLRSTANSMATQLDSLAAAMSYQAHAPTPAPPYTRVPRVAVKPVSSVVMAEDVGGGGMDQGDGSVGEEVEKFSGQVWGDWETPGRRMRPRPPSHVTPPEPPSHVTPHITFAAHAPTGEEAGLEGDGGAGGASLDGARESHLQVVRRLLQNSRTGDAADTPAAHRGASDRDHQPNVGRGGVESGAGAWRDGWRSVATGESAAGHDQSSHGGSTHAATTRHHAGSTHAADPSAFSHPPPPPTARKGRQQQQQEKQQQQQRQQGAVTWKAHLKDAVPASRLGWASGDPSRCASGDTSLAKTAAVAAASRAAGGGGGGLGLFSSQMSDTGSPPKRPSAPPNGQRSVCN